eukprot:1153481-Pelagomonas_calceolata.AAC.5
MAVSSVTITQSALRARGRALAAAAAGLSGGRPGAPPLPSSAKAAGLCGGEGKAEASDRPMPPHGPKPPPYAPKGLVLLAWAAAVELPACGAWLWLPLLPALFMPPP